MRSSAELLPSIRDYDLPHVLGNNGNPSLSDSTFRGEPIRRVTLRTHTSAGPADVTVAETIRKRQRVRTQLLSTVLAVDLVEIAAILALACLVTERFFRGRNTRGDGSGLGLAIVSEIARLHAGRLAIGPGRDGRGTCVRVLFPAS